MSNRGKLQMPPKLTMQGSQKSFAFGTLGKSARGLLNRRAADDELRRKDDADKLEQEKQEQLQQGAELEQKELSGTTVQELAQRLDTNIEKGLTTAEVAERLEKYGRNELEKQPPTPLWRMFLEQFNDILVILLIAACIISAALNQIPAAVTILIIITLNAIIGLVQEAKAGAALEALESLSADRAEVVRDGNVIVVDGPDLVPGDIIKLSTGQKLPADIRLVEAHSLICSEMALTGESEGVKKDAAYISPMEDDDKKEENDEEKKEKSLTSANMVYMGCSLLDGRGIGLVCHTGMKTRMGTIARLLNEAESGGSPLQDKLQRLGVKLGLASLAISAVVFVVGAILNRKPEPDSDQNVFLQLLLLSVSLTVAAVPEGLPAAVTITLALGMRRMVHKGALIRNLSSVETLGSASVICSDKTGTLTAGVMTAVRLWVDGVSLRISGKAYEPVGEFEGAREPLSIDRAQALPLLAAALCSNATLQKDDEGEWQCLGNTSERPLVVAAAKAGIESSTLQQEYERLKENPFSSVRKMMSTLVANSPTAPARFPNAPAYVALVKGAPNIVLDRCVQRLDTSSAATAQLKQLTDADRETVMSAVDSYSSEALRVLAVAYRPFASLPSDDGAAVLERDLVLCGLVASIDPERDEVIPSIDAARTAGVRVCMITGDYVKTAKAIAENINLLPKGASNEGMAVDCEVVRSLGLVIEKLENEAASVNGPQRKTLENRIEAEWKKVDAITAVADVYARAKPEDKITIVRSLQRQGNICSMTGDGVNDAPALKQANIGVAMGITGTDVAKASADMVLTNDNFCSIVDAIEEGRTIYANIGKFVFYLLSTNISEVFLILFALLIGLPIPLSTIQILWLNLATDGAPAVALAVEQTDPGMMEQGPRDKKEELIEHVMLTGIAIQTLVLTSSCLMVYILGLYWNTGTWNGSSDGYDIAVYAQLLRKAQTMTIIFIVFAELLRAHTCRSLRVSLWSMGPFSNPYMHAAVGVAVSATLMLALVPWFQGIFGLETLQGREWGLVLGMAFVPAVIDEITKFVYRASGFGERPKADRPNPSDIHLDVVAANSD